jgi:hypothetical protein
MQENLIEVLGDELEVRINRAVASALADLPPKSSHLDKVCDILIYRD